MYTMSNPGAATEISVLKTWEKILKEIKYAMGEVLDEEVVSKVEFNQEDLEWFLNVCMIALGPNPVVDREDDEEEEKDPRPLAE